jgi:uncharacterized membrane protein YbhN (UPF0104 family)
MATDSTLPVELSESDREELRMLYKVSASDIAMFTHQQWSTTTYALAIYAALLFISYQPSMDPYNTWQGWLPLVLSWAVCISGLVAVKRLQFSIVAGRRRLERVRVYFGRPFMEAWSVPKPPDDVHRLLYLVMLLSAVVVTVLVVIKH